MHSSNQMTRTPEKLNVLSKIAKIFYQDVTYIILDYIISRPDQLIEEIEMSNKLNLSYGTVRTSLTLLKKDGILLESEHKKKPIEDVQPQTTTTIDSISNPSALSIQKDTKANYKKNYGSYRKSKTSDWKLNDTFYNAIKTRFEKLKKQLANNLEKRATLWFECPNCHKTYSEAEGSFNNVVCINCENRPKLMEKGKEDVSNLKIKCNELIGIMNDLFLENDKFSDFQHKQRTTKANQNKDEGMSTGPKKSNNFEIVVENLEDPEVEKSIQEIKTDKKKRQMFQDIMEYYIYEKYMKKKTKK